FDPLLAKLIVWAPSRPAAIARMKRALDDFVLLGVRNNIEFLRRVISTEDFSSGKIDTSFLNRHAELFTVSTEVPAEARLVATRFRPETQGRQDVWSSGSWSNSGGASASALPCRLIDSHHAEIAGKRHHFHILHRHDSD